MYEPNKSPNHLPDLLIGGTLIVGAAIGVVSLAPALYILGIGLIATLVVLGGMLTVAGSLFSTGRFIDGLIAWQIVEAAFRIAWAIVQVTVKAAGGTSD